MIDFHLFFSTFKFLADKEIKRYNEKNLLKKQ